VRRIIVLMALVSTFVTGDTHVVAAPPASAALVPAFTIVTWPPALNTKGNVFAKAQTKVVSGPTPDKLGIVVCLVAWDGNSYFQLSTCTKGSASNVNQITRNRTIPGCNPTARYGTKARGWLSDGGVIYYGPGPGPGSFLYNPSSGGVKLC
jgi:hypothetical protein